MITATKSTYRKDLIAQVIYFPIMGFLSAWNYKSGIYYFRSDLAIFCWLGSGA